MKRTNKQKTEQILVETPLFKKGQKVIAHYHNGEDRIETILSIEFAKPIFEQDNGLIPAHPFYHFVDGGALYESFCSEYKGE